MKNIGKLSVILFSVLIIIALAMPYSISAADQVSYPNAINGLPVILVETSANDVAIPKGHVTLVLLDTTSTTPEESSARLDLNNYLTHNPLASNWSFDIYGGPGVTKEGIINAQKADNNWQKQHGVIKLGPIQASISPDITANTAGPFQVDMFNDPATDTVNYETYDMVAPTISGNYEDSYAYFGLNGMTNVNNYFLQSGQIFANGSTRLVWADSTTNYNVNTFTGPSYIGGHNYTFYIYYYGPGSGSYTEWQMSVLDHATDQWGTHIETHATGTQFIQNINESIFFENYNTASNWYAGFNSGTVAATNSWKGEGHVANGGWTGTETSWDSDTLYNNIYGAMSGSLVYWGTTTWTLSKIPLGTNP